MIKSLLFISLMIGAIYPSSLLHADIIYLKDGSRVKGEITRASQDEVTIDVPVEGFKRIYEPHIVKRADIDRIERDKIKYKEKIKKPIDRIFYKGRWIVPEDKEKVDKELKEREEERERQHARQIEAAKRHKLENKIRGYLARLEICEGMTREQVKKVWSDPDDIRVDTEKEQWVYNAYKYYVTKSEVIRERHIASTDFIGYVFFDEDGKVKRYINNSGKGGYLLPGNVRNWYIKNNQTPDTMWRR